MLPLRGPRLKYSGRRIGIQYYPHADQVRQASRLQLLDNVGAMQLHRAEADAETAGDALVGLACGHQLENLALAGCQRGHADLQRGAFETLFIRSIIPMQRALDAFNQRVLAQRVLDEVEGAGLHCCNRQRNGTMPSDEDHRDTPAADIEKLL